MTLRLSDLRAGFAVAPKDTGRYNAARAAKANNISVSTLRAHGYLRGYELDATQTGNLSDLLLKDFDLRHSLIDPSRAARELGWRARTALAAGLAKT